MPSRCPHVPFPKNGPMTLPTPKKKTHVPDDIEFRRSLQIALGFPDRSGDWRPGSPSKPGRSMKLYGRDGKFSTVLNKRKQPRWRCTGLSDVTRKPRLRFLVLAIFFFFLWFVLFFWDAKIPRKTRRRKGKGRNKSSSLWLEMRRLLKFTQLGKRTRPVCTSKRLSVTACVIRTRVLRSGNRWQCLFTAERKDGGLVQSAMHAHCGRECRTG